MNISGMFEDTGSSREVTFSSTFDISDDPAQVSKMVVDDCVMVRKVAKILLHKGLCGKNLRVTIAKLVGNKISKASADAIQEELQNEGVTGFVAVDSSAFRNCKEAYDYANKQNPFSKFVKFALYNPKCPGCVSGIMKRSNSEPANDSGSIDALLSSKKLAFRTSRPRCDSCGLFIIAGHGEIQKEDLDPTLIDLMNVGKITREAFEILRGGRVVASLKKAQFLASVQEKRAQDAPVDREGISANLSVQIDEEKSLPPVSVEDVSANSKMPSISPDDDFRLDSRDIQSNSGQEVELFGECDFQIDPSDIQPEDGQQFELDDANDPLLDVEEKAELGDFDVQERGPDFLDVDPATFEEEEFHGTDEIDFDKQKKHPGQLDINMKQDITF